MNQSTHSTQIDEAWLDELHNRSVRQFEQSKRKEIERLNRDRLRTVEKKAQEKFIEQVLLKHYSENFANSGEMPTDVEDVKEITLAADKVSERYNRKPRNCLLTVNPKPGVSLDELKGLMLKLISKSYIDRYLYVYEVRKADYTGLHVHMVCTYTGRPNNFQRGIKSLFRRVCDVDNSSILNFKFLPDELVSEKLDYLLGKKQKKKQVGVQASIAFRKDKDLQPHYESDPPLSCRVTQLTPVPLIEEVKE